MVLTKKTEESGRGRQILPAITSVLLVDNVELPLEVFYREGRQESDRLNHIITLKWRETVLEGR